MVNGLDVILVVILLSILLSLGSSRMTTLIKIMALQGAMVSCAGLLLDLKADLAATTIVFFQVMLLVKGVLIPGLLYFALMKAAIKREVEPIIGYHASLLVGLGLILLSVYLAGKLKFSLSGDYSLLLITAITTMGGGLFLMMSRTKALTQVIGYLMLENGIYLIGVALTKKSHNMFLVEFGILLDLLVGVMIMGIILHNITRTFDDVDTMYLGQLKD